MTDRRRSQSERERRLEQCRRDYDAIKAKLAEVGFICEGSVAEIRTSCGNPNCRCKDPTHRHGPYYQLTWKQAGKTITRRLSAEEARLYREWISNRRQLQSVVEQMQDLSRQAGEHILAEIGRPFQGPNRSPRQRRPSSKRSA